jgi:hypothetical protein
VSAREASACAGMLNLARLWTPRTDKGVKVPDEKSPRVVLEKLHGSPVPASGTAVDTPPAHSPTLAVETDTTAELPESLVLAPDRLRRMSKYSSNSTLAKIARFCPNRYETSAHRRLTPPCYPRRSRKHCCSSERILHPE